MCSLPDVLGWSALHSSGSRLNAFACRFWQVYIGARAPLLLASDGPKRSTRRPHSPTRGPIRSTSATWSPRCLAYLRVATPDTLGRHRRRYATTAKRPGASGGPHLSRPLAECFPMLTIFRGGATPVEQVI